MRSRRLTMSLCLPWLLSRLRDGRWSWGGISAWTTAGSRRKRRCSPSLFPLSRSETYSQKPPEADFHFSSVGQSRSPGPSCLGTDWKEDTGLLGSRWSSPDALPEAGPGVSKAERGSGEWASDRLSAMASFCPLVPSALIRAVDVSG